jgi:large subunit ribosomal protein L28
MARICDLTGKRTISGNNVSHANNKTKRKFYPNLQLKNFYIPETDSWIRLKVTAQAIKTINSQGVYEYLKKLEKKGDIVLR